MGEADGSEEVQEELDEISIDYHQDHSATPRSQRELRGSLQGDSSVGEEQGISQQASRSSLEAEESLKRDQGELSLREFTGSLEPHEAGGTSLSREELLEALRSAQRVAQHLAHDVSSYQRELSALRSLHSRTLLTLRNFNARTDHLEESSGDEQYSVDDALHTAGLSKSHVDEVELAQRVAKRRGILIDESDVLVGAELGRGTGGVVYSGRWRAAPVAVKKKAVDDAASFGVHREAVCMMRGRHPNCVALHAVVADTKLRKLWLLMDAMEESVSSWIKRSTPGGGKDVPLSSRLCVALDVARALAALQAESVIHRDVKSSNVFMTTSGKAKLGDFGLAAREPADDSEAGPTPETGSYLYCAPENIRHQRYGTAVDVYSLGVLTNELCTLETPYEEKHLLPSDAAVGAADKQMRPQLPAKGSMHGGVIALVEAMWRQDPGERPPASEVAHKLEHFVQQVSQLEEQEKQQPPLERLRTLFKSVGG